MKRSKLPGYLLPGFLLPFCGLLTLAFDAGALQVNAVVSDNGSSFHYDVTVLNDDPIADLLVVSIEDAPLSDPLIGASLTAPAGFLASHDQGLGVIDLLADTSTFIANLTTGPFSFDSTFAPGQVFTRYSALNLNGDLFSGDVATRIAQGVPLPGSLALLVVGVGALLCVTGRQPDKRLPYYA